MNKRSLLKTFIASPFATGLFGKKILTQELEIYLDQLLGNPAMLMSPAELLEILGVVDDRKLSRNAIGAPPPIRSNKLHILCDLLDDSGEHDIARDDLHNINTGCNTLLTRITDLLFGELTVYEDAETGKGFVGLAGYLKDLHGLINGSTLAEDAAQNLLIQTLENNDWVNDMEEHISSNNNAIVFIAKRLSGLSKLTERQLEGYIANYQAALPSLWQKLYDLSHWLSRNAPAGCRTYAEHNELIDMGRKAGLEPQKHEHLEKDRTMPLCENAAAARKFVPLYAANGDTYPSRITIKPQGASRMTWTGKITEKNLTNICAAV